MKMYTSLTPVDFDIIESKVRDFLPSRIYDIHSHLVNDAFTSSEHRWTCVPNDSVLDAAVYARAMEQWLPAKRTGTLFFGDPSLGNDRTALNAWVADEAVKDSAYSRSLAVVAPEDDQASVAADLRAGRHIGLKPYHVYAGKEDTRNVEIEEFAPEWMWELCHENNGILMMHLMRDRAIADAKNQEALRRLCKAYPRCRLVLAHIARSFNYRHALEGLHVVADLDNVWVDTSAIAESPAFIEAIEILGPERILFGTDYPISEVRGKATAIGDRFHWFYANELPVEAASLMTLCGIESLVSLREACEYKELSRNQIEGIFHDNAFELMVPHVSVPGAGYLAEAGLNGRALVG